MDVHINDWLEECARLSPPPTPTHQQVGAYSHSQYQPSKMSSSDLPGRKTSRKQPNHNARTTRGASSLNIDLTLFPDLSPPTSQFDPLVADTANLNINTSPTTSDISSFTPLPSISHRSKNTAKDSDGRTSRSRSPVKKVVDLSAARPQIKYNPGEVPEDVGLILKKLKKTLKGKRIMPLCLKDDIKKLDPNQFYETEDEFDQCSQSSVASERKILKKLTKIRDNALNCSRESKPEPSWGSEVFRPLLDLAVKIENTGMEQKVQAEDITTIPVSPTCLPLGVYDSPLQAKRIDYGIYLSQDNDQQQLLRDRLEARNIAAEDLCVNQTPPYAGYIRWIPQILAVETKTGEPSGVSAEAQLAIWMAGLRKKLEGMQVDKSMHLKPMPCLKAQGLEWKMYWCTVGQKGETILHGPQELGTTQTILGCYRIFTILRELIRYGRDEYAPWVMKECYW